ncbi:MAG: asparagine synthase (glutamine-hydrolyzing) [Planctomycetota bacterium]
MCGICGLIGNSPLAHEELERVRAANATLFHRGPDGDGELVVDRVMLAMRRLAIIDLTGGWQPLFNEDKSIAVVANGEIYNYPELRKDLESRGHKFRTGSDCENIIHAYEEYGLDFVHQLRGMFGFALYDANRRRVIIARDRMGEKPLYLFEKPGRILFASEMKAILATGLVKFELDPVAINDFFHFQYVPDPATAVVGVRKLPAGHMLIIDLEPWKVEQKCYWRMDDAPALTGDPKTLIREQLEQIGQLIIRSDVPVAVALSGGLDSSTVAALAAKNSPGQIHALSIGYAGRPHMDERARAKQLAEHLKMPFHDYEVRAEEVAEVFPERNFMRDDPIADISGHGYYALSRLARANNIPVLLQGHGIDELFWGYSWVRISVQAAMKRCGRMPTKLTDRFGYIRKLFPVGTQRRDLRNWAMHVGGMLMGWKSLRPLLGSGRDVVPFYNINEDFEMGRYASNRIFPDSFREKFTSRKPEDWFTVAQPWPDLGVLITKLICEMFLLENGINQGDRLGMAWAVELRLPFVDYRLVETAIGLRKASPDHMLGPKARFREVIKDLLPDWVLARPKTGFTPPSREWIGVLVGKYGENLANGYLVEKGILDPRWVRCATKHHSQVSAWPTTLYKMLVLEWWARGMSEIAQYRPASQILEHPGRPNLNALLAQRATPTKPAPVPVA